MRTPIAHIQHFLTLFDNINASAALVQDPEHPQTLFVAKSPWEAVRWARKFMSADEWYQVSGLTPHSCQEGGKKIDVENSTQPSDDEATMASKSLVRTRNLGRGHETPDIDLSDSLQSCPKPKPKRRRMLPVTDEVSDDQLSSHFRSSKLVTRQRPQKPKACHQMKSLCRITSDNSDDCDDRTSTSSKPHVSDADDEDDMSPECAEVGDGAAPVRTSPTPSPSKIQGGILVEDLTSISEESLSSQNAKAELERLESITGIHASQNHRDAIVKQCLALGKRDTLENFRLACLYWRKHHMPAGQESIHSYDLTLQRRSALERFSYAYHAAQTTITQRAVLDILYRVDLAHLHEVYLGALEAFSRFSFQEKKVAKFRPLEAFDDDVRSVAVDQMYWACYPDLQGKPRSYNKSLARKFTKTLEHAEKWLLVCPAREV